MASYEGGYDEERFESSVPENLHCSICFNVLRKPMQCVRNEHSFCKPCITRHLQENAPSCPTCMEPLTLETLRPSRLVTNLLSQLRIRCDNSYRGCQECVRLEILEGHVANCEFSPVQCSNDGCEVIINRKDQPSHEMNDCNVRQGKCEVCGENVAYVRRQLHCYVTKNEMDMNMREEMRLARSEMRYELSKVMAVVADMRKQMDDVSERVSGLERVVCENKKAEQPREPQIHSDLSRSKENSDGREDIIIAGGGGSKSVEKFCWSTGLWTLLSSMTSLHYLSSSFVYQGQMFVCGGAWSDMIEILELKKEGGEWKELSTKLSPKTSRHASIVYEENLYIFGGRSGGKVVNDIYKVGLVSLCPSQLVSHLPKARSGHGAQRFGDKVAIVGGTTTGDDGGSLDKVLLYDITRNCCRTLAPLPFAISDMATVAWRDNIIIIGGQDNKGNVLNTVVSYNITNEKSEMLPPMKQERSYCTAVRTGNVIVVMGGWGKEGYLNSVESFSFDDYSWEELPVMNEKRNGATAVVNMFCK